MKDLNWCIIDHKGRINYIGVISLKCEWVFKYNRTYDRKHTYTDREQGDICIKVLKRM